MPRTNQLWRCSAEPCDRLGRDSALDTLLDAVVADRGGGTQSVLDVGTREVLDEPRAERVRDPYPREAVGLQLDSHGTSLRP